MPNGGPGSADRGDLPSMLLTASDATDGQGLPNTEIVDQVVTFVLGGGVVALLRGGQGGRCRCSAQIAGASSVKARGLRAANRRRCQVRSGRGGGSGRMDEPSARTSNRQGEVPWPVDRAFWGACHGGQRRAAEYLLDRGATPRCRRTRRMAAQPLRQNSQRAELRSDDYPVSETPR